MTTTTTVYAVTVDRPKVPAARFVAEDLVDLGNQIASYLFRHGQLSRTVPFDVEIDYDHGRIRQSGMARPIAFTITPGGDHS